MGAFSTGSGAMSSQKGPPSAQSLDSNNSNERRVRWCDLGGGSEEDYGLGGYQMLTEESLSQLDPESRRLSFFQP